MNKKSSLYVFLVIIAIIITGIIIKVPHKGTYSLDNASKIHFMATGESDAILIESNGHYGLIDASNPYNDDLSQYQYEGWSINKVTGYLDKILGTNKKLDFVLVTHAHYDHNGGIDVIANKYVDSNTIYYYRQYVSCLEDTEHPNWYTQTYYQRAYNAMHNAGAILTEITNNNLEFTMGEYTIKFLNTEPWDTNDAGYLAYGTSKAYNDNANSIGTLITKGNIKVFLAADIETYDEDKIATAVGQVDVLKMGHHGLSTSTSYNFMNTLRPRYAIVTNIKSNAREEGKDNDINNASKAYMIDNFNTTIYATTEYKSSNITAEAIVLTITDDINFSLSNNQSVELLNMNDYLATKTGWYKIPGGNKWVYLKNGKLTKSEWKISSGYWYYLGDDGTTINGEATINSDDYNQNFDYYFDSTGKMTTGFRKTGTDDWYYYAKTSTNNYPEGAKVRNDWIYHEDNWYYFDNNGLMQRGLLKIGNHNYYFNPEKTANYPEGAMITGWLSLNNNYYFFNKTANDDYPKGAMITGWLKDNNKWYYFDDTGKMVTGTHYLDDGNGNWYYYTFDNTGAYVSKVAEITYNITYELNGGVVANDNPTSYSTNSESITLINPTKTGYTFTGWTGSNGNNPEKPVVIAHGSMNDRHYIANWTPNTDTPYTVNHYTYDSQNEIYVLNETEHLTGTTGSKVILANLKKAITGYVYVAGYLTGDTTKPTTNPVKNTTIKADGTRVINLYYLKNDFSINNRSISLDDIIYDLNSETTVNQLISDVTITSGEVIIKDNSDNNISNNAILKTGYRLVISFADDNTTIEYPISVKGDVLGEGHTSPAGAKKAARHIINKNVLTGEYLLSADMDNNGEIRMNDVMRILNN